jgi:glycosyltransferase involved in cell wall biosynthesis
MIYYDPRWQGSNGIARFSSAVMARLSATALPITGNPAGSLDCLKLSFALFRVPPGSVFFSPGYNSPLFSPVPFVLTVHDLNHIDRPENSSISKRLYYSLVLKSACHRAASVLTVSEFSRKRILEWSGLAAERVVNVGNGVDRDFGSSVEPHTPGYPYFLCVGNRKLHKNELRVIDAFHAAHLSPEVRLMFTGNATPEFIARIAGKDLTDRVVFAGAIPERRLPGYYAGALALVFPSLYEGFGLPVLEAMACGIPVITSNTTALPEVAGDAALLVDPESVEEIAAALKRVVNDSSLREELGRKGCQRAADFTWESTAAKIAGVLQGISAVG